MHFLKVEYNVCMCEAYIIPTLETLKSIMLYWHTFIVLYIPIRIYKKMNRRQLLKSQFLLKLVPVLSSLLLFNFLEIATQLSEYAHSN